MTPHRLALCAAAALTVAVPAAEPDPAKLDFFEKKVRPILVHHCHACHAAETKPAGGLRVDDRNGLLVGGNTRPAVVPGKPAASLLLERVGKSAKKRMPAEGEHLTEEQIAILTRWIEDGAAWPAVRLPASLGKPKARYEKLKKEHWAFQSVVNPSPPRVRNDAWPRDDVDRFLLARLEADGLAPVGDADKTALLRRLTFDLTGLPPTPRDLDDFLADPSAGALARAADRLLASPQFGEHWGRHWLDVARYGESTGPSRNIPYPHAWRYRDYVIDAINADVPFQRFVTEQLAGDLLSAANDRERDRLLVATGFLALGVKDVNQRFKIRFQMDNVDEQLDAVTRSVLALTVSCARCHDHKFDPVPQTDYYALAGIFTSTENAAGVRSLMGGGGLAYYAPEQLVRLKGTGPAASPMLVAKLEAEVAEAKKAWDTIRGTPEGLKPDATGQPTQRPIRLKYEKLQADLAALTDPKQSSPAAHGAREAGTVGDTELRVRGEAEKVGPVVARGYLGAFAVPGATPVNPKQSGRLELAAWLTSDRNPLTARVFVNRVWSHLFGRGLVGTVDNFGVTGDGPSHPELLDHLAQRFMADGWSLKRLVRTLVLTRAYGLSSATAEEPRRRDPGNRLVWRHAPRRLTAEEYRDAALAVSGLLDPRRADGSAAMQLKMVEMRDDGPEAKALHDAADASIGRSVYLPLVRGVTLRALEAFDPVDQTLVTGGRDQTTVPSQALFLLNAPFVRRQAQALATRLARTGPPEDAGRVALAYRLALGREPTLAETARATTFLDDYAAAASGEGNARTAAWQALAQGLLASAEFRYLK